MAGCFWACSKAGKRGGRGSVADGLLAVGEAHLIPSPGLKKLFFLNSLLESTSLRRELRNRFIKEKREASVCGSQRALRAGTAPGPGFSGMAVCSLHRTEAKKGVGLTHPQFCLS